MKNIKYILLLLCLWVFTTTNILAKGIESSTLHFNKNGTFKIVQFTDIHWETGMPANPITILTMENILDREKPDLVVLTGDIVTSKDPQKGWEEVAAPLINRKIRWVATLGNHDSEGDTPRNVIHKIIQSLPYNLNQSALNTSGQGNFSVPVLASDNKTNGAILYFFDSHAYASPYLPGGYDWIKIDQIEWYKNQSNHYRSENQNYPIPSYAFFHIPLCEYKFVKDDANTVGNIGEEVSSPEINTGLFAGMVEQRDVIGVFTGHDHNNDFIGTYKDIALAYGRCSGTYAYGKLRRGARVVQINENEFHFNSWISTPRGKSAEFIYPSTKNKFSLNEAPLPSVKLDKDKLTQGLNYSYYEGEINSVDEISNLPEIKTGTTTNFSLTQANAKDHFAFIFEGYLKISSTDCYQFYLLSDDGSKIYIDDQLIVDNDGGHSIKLKKGLVNLEEGFHKIRLTYFEDYMGNELEVGISSLKMRDGILPDNLLFILKK